MAEREPQNKQKVFEGFMRGLITMVKLPEMCQHDERRKGYEAGKLGDGKGNRSGDVDD